MTMEERKAKGLLWTDTPEAMAAQVKARGLVYDFNHTRPEEKEKRMALLPQIFGMDRAAANTGIRQNGLHW